MCWVESRGIILLASIVAFLGCYPLGLLGCFNVVESRVVCPSLHVSSVSSNGCRSPSLWCFAQLAQLHTERKVALQQWSWIDHQMDSMEVVIRSAPASVSKVWRAKSIWQWETRCFVIPLRQGVLASPGMTTSILCVWNSPRPSGVWRLGAMWIHATVSLWLHPRCLITWKPLTKAIRSTIPMKPVETKTTTHQPLLKHVWTRKRTPAMANAHGLVVSVLARNWQRCAKISSTRRPNKVMMMQQRAGDFGTKHDLGKLMPLTCKEWRMLHSCRRISTLCQQSFGLKIPHCETNSPNSQVLFPCSVTVLWLVLWL